MSISMGIYFLWVFVSVCRRFLPQVGQVINFIKVTRSLAVAIQCYAVLRPQRELPPLTCLHKTGPWLAAISCYWLLSLMRNILSMFVSFLSLSLRRMSFMMMALNTEHNAYKFHSMCCTPMAAQALQDRSVSALCSSKSMLKSNWI